MSKLSSTIETQVTQHTEVKLAADEREAALQTQVGELLEQMTQVMRQNASQRVEVKMLKSRLDESEAAFTAACEQVVALKKEVAGKGGWTRGKAGSRSSASPAMPYPPSGSPPVGDMSRAAEARKAPKPVENDDDEPEGAGLVAYELPTELESRTDAEDVRFESRKSEASVSQVARRSLAMSGASSSVELKRGELARSASEFDGPGPMLLTVQSYQRPQSTGKLRPTFFGYMRRGDRSSSKDSRRRQSRS